MLDYILRCIILIPLVGGLAWCSLWLWRRTQLGVPAFASRDRAASVVDVISLGSQNKLAVVNFGERTLLLAVSRTQINLIAEHAKD